MVKKSTADKELVDGTATHSPYVEVAGHQHETVCENQFLFPYAQL